MDKLIELPPINSFTGKTSLVKVHNWLKSFPEFMTEADVIFSDPPWTLANVSFYFNKINEKAGVPYEQFAEKFLETVYRINPRLLLIAMGKEYLSFYLDNIKKQYKYVTFYNSTYYGKKENKCYIIHATHSSYERKFRELEDMPSKNIFDWVCRYLAFKCIGDLCMGKGIVGRTAYKYGRRFVGTELNKDRLQCLIDYINKKENKNV